MKKFISMVMAAAMVVSLVPATAFAKGEVTASAKIVDALELTKDEAKKYSVIDQQGHYKNEVPELQLSIKDVDYMRTDGEAPTMDVTLTLDNASFKDTSKAYLKSLVRFVLDSDRYEGAIKNAWVKATTFSEATHLVNPAPVSDPVEDADAIVRINEEFPADLEEQADVVSYLDEHGATFDLISSRTSAIKVKEGEDTIEVCATDGTWKNGYADVDALMAAVMAGNVTITDGLNQIDVKLSAAITNASALTAGTLDTFSKIEVEKQVKVYIAENPGYGMAKQGTVSGSTTVNGKELEVIDVKDIDDSEATFVIKGYFAEGDKVIFDMESVLDKISEGKKATVSVDSKMVSADDLVYVSILGQGISASVKKVANVAEEEKINLEKDLKITSNVGNFTNGQKFTLKLSKGFEFSDFDNTGKDYVITAGDDDNEVEVEFIGVTDTTDEIVIKAADLEIEATSAKSGATATITVKAEKVTGEDGTFSATTTVEVAKVVDYKVVLSVDEDEDIPVIYSGVNVDNYGITDDSDHWSLEVTAEETFPGAWSMRKGFNFELPEGVYVTDVDVTEAEYFYINGEEVNVGSDEVEAAFWNAYQEGSHVNFEFEKRVFDDVDSDLRDKECATMTFQLQLVADPTFDGDVVLKLNGDLVDEQEVTIAKFVKPYTVKAEQNDLIIDYRYTDIPTAITITEAEAGLWAKDEATFRFTVERGDLIEFEDDPTYEIDKDSELELKGKDTVDGTITFTVKSESEEAATVTLKDMQLFMQRNIPAGPYDLSINSSLEDAYLRETLFAPDDVTTKVTVQAGNAPDRDSYDTYNWAVGDPRPAKSTVKDDTFIDDVCDYSDTVKEAFVNVVTAGRDKDDASFTTKVVVPVGESYLIAGETQITLDVPAYINAAGYTMLPVRAVATALGILNNNVLWDGATKTVTILYGQRIITMVAGQKVVYVNGSAIPASASVEIVNGRTFLPMRDLATALGVTDITWDAATKTATLNGNQK